MLQLLLCEAALRCEAREARANHLQGSVRMALLEVLLVGDSDAVAPFLKEAETAGLSCEVCSNTRSLASKTREGSQEVVLLHQLGFADDGFEVCKRVRKNVGGR